MPAVLGYRHDATFAVHTIACQCYEAFFNSNRGVRVRMLVTEAHPARCSANPENGATMVDRT
eukprot:COSAG05_NODE_19433_length_292_cov_4814.813472_1_plen_61_part_10